MRHNYILTYIGSQFVQTHFTEWGAAENPEVVCCVHGLTRNSRDFDELARALSERFRVVCVDVVGRGLSGWLDNAKDYNYVTYANQLGGVLAHINAKSVRWVGTSMGGILGMLLAAAPNSPITQMVISDVGPVIPEASLKQIAEYLGNAPTFPSLTEAEQYLRLVHSGFGQLGNQQWRHLAQHSTREEQGVWRLHYDPAIAVAFQEISGEVDLTPVWHQVTCSVLVLRGAESQLLGAKLAGEMALRPNVRLIELPGVGHAPMMMSPGEINSIEEFFCYKEAEEDFD